MATGNSRKSARPKQTAKFEAKSDDVVNAMDADEFADYLLETIKHSSARLAKSDLNSFESRFEGVHSRRARRAALAYLTFTGKELFEKVERDRDFAIVTAGAAASIEEYEKYLREVADLVGQASTMMNVALCCREDMESVKLEGLRRLSR